MSRTVQVALVSLLSVFLAAFAVADLGAETIMIAVRETVDGTPSAPPLPTVEAVSSSLFDAGHVVFDAGKIDPSTKTVELAKIARDGNAGWLLLISVVYTQTKVDQDAVRVACSAKFSLVNTGDGTTPLTDTVTATNAGREKDTDRLALGMELGRLISRQVLKALPSPSL
jgi:hypothetical protein